MIMFRHMSKYINGPDPTWVSNLSKPNKPTMYGTRHGVSLPKQIKKMEVLQHNRYFCEFCKKYAVKRKAVGYGTAKIVAT